MPLLIGPRRAENLRRWKLIAEANWMAMMIRRIQRAVENAASVLIEGALLRILI